MAGVALQSGRAVHGQLHRDGLADWEFLTGRRVLHSADLAQPFRGLRPPREVVDKIHRRNAQALFGNAWSPAAARR